MAVEWKDREVYSKGVVWLVFVMAMVATILLAIYTCTWLGEYQYNVQIARHVCILLWLVALTMSYQFPEIMKPFYIFPKAWTTTFFIVGLAYILIAIMMLADPTLVLLYKGNKGVKYITVQGTRTLPKLEPRAIFNAAIGLYSGIAAAGVGFWVATIYVWVADIGKK